MTQGVLITIAVVLGWIVLAAIQRRLQARHRNRAFWALILIGIPVLGWLTLNGGPMAGVAGLAIGIIIEVEIRISYFLHEHPYAQETFLVLFALHAVQP